MDAGGDGAREDREGKKYCSFSSPPTFLSPPGSPIGLMDGGLQATTEQGKGEE